MGIQNKSVTVSRCDNPGCHVVKYTEGGELAEGFHGTVLEFRDADGGTGECRWFACIPEHIQGAIEYVLEQADEQQYGNDDIPAVPRKLTTAEKAMWCDRELGCTAEPGVACTHGTTGQPLKRPHKCRTDAWREAGKPSSPWSPRH